MNVCQGKVSECLARTGFAQIHPLYDYDTLTNWNRKLDQLFEEVAERDRSYIGPATLLDLGILQEIFHRFQAPDCRRHARCCNISLSRL